MLLSGSGIEAVAQPGGGYVLRRASSQAGAETVLRPVTVLGARDAAEPLANVPAAISVVPRERIETELPVSNRIEDLIARTAPAERYRRRTRSARSKSRAAPIPPMASARRAASSRCPRRAPNRTNWP
jgi:hypothetical protein